MFKGKVRSPIAVILLTIFTCGIYGIYWFFAVTGEVNGALGEKKISAGLYFFLSIITCGIAYFVWMYKMDAAVFEIRSRAGLPAKNNFVLWLILTLLVGVGSYVMYYQVQDQLNEVWEKA